MAVTRVEKRLLYEDIVSKRMEIWQWPVLIHDAYGGALEMPLHTDKSVQIEGTFGTGGSISIQGSNDGENFETIHDGTGADLTFTAAGLQQVLENTRYIRPNCTEGDATTNVTVTLLLVKPQS